MYLLLRAHVVGAPQILDNNHIAAGRRPGLGCVLSNDAVQSHTHVFLCHSGAVALWARHARLRPAFRTLLTQFDSRGAPSFASGSVFSTSLTSCPAPV